MPFLRSAGHLLLPSGPAGPINLGPSETEVVTHGSSGSPKWDSVGHIWHPAPAKGVKRGVAWRDWHLSSKAPSRPGRVSQQSPFPQTQMSPGGIVCRRPPQPIWFPCSTPPSPSLWSASSPTRRPGGGGEPALCLPVPCWRAPLRAAQLSPPSPPPFSSSLSCPEERAEGRVQRPGWSRLEEAKGLKWGLPHAPASCCSCWGSSSSCSTSPASTSVSRELGSRGGGGQGPKSPGCSSPSLRFSSCSKTLPGCLCPGQTSVPMARGDAAQGGRGEMKSKAAVRGGGSCTFFPLDWEGCQRALEFCGS